MKQEKIFVLQIGMTPNPGGIESYVMNLYRKIDKNKVQFDFVDWCGEENIAFSEEIKKLGGRIFKIPTRRDNYLENKRAIDKLVGTGKYRYVYNNLNSLSNISGVTATDNIVNTIPIIHAHNDSIEKGLLVSKILDKIHKPYINSQKCIRLACSQQAGEWMFPHSKFSVVADSIDTTLFEYSESIRKHYRHMLNIENKFVVGSVARFSPQKNISFLIDVFKKICEKKKNVVLVLVGTGSQKKLIKAKVFKYHLEDKVIFLGTRNDTSSLMQAMDAMVAPSVFEGFGMSVLEAQCSGLPCYVSDAFNDEVIQTTLVKKIPLTDTALEWATLIISDLSFFKEKRVSYSSVIRENGYDSEQVANGLTDKFINGFTGGRQGESR